MKISTKINLALSAIFALLMISGTCFAGQPLVFGSTSKIEPMAYMENDTIKGFYFDVFREISKRANFKVTYKLYPFKRLNNYLQNGTIDGTLCIYYKKERESYLRYSDEPMITSRTLVFVKKGNEFPLSSINDLFGKQIGIMAGWSMANDDYNKAKSDGNITIQEVTKYEQNLKKLMSDKLDCVIMTEQTTWYHASRMGIDDKINSLNMVFSEAKPYIAISKKSRGIKSPQQFMITLNAAFKKILEDGTYDNILKKYGLRNIN